MSRYIDADALTDEFEWCKQQATECNRKEWDEIITRVSKQPTLDAVPVVRCGECKHCFVDGDNVRFNVCELTHNRVQSDDWFCADGERKESNNE